MASNTLAPISTSVPALQVQRNGTCCVCLRPVYAMEAVVAQFKFYHKGCLKCAQCNRTLSIANYASHNGSVYCTAHLPKTPQLTTPTGRRNSDDKTFGSLSGFSSTYTTTTAGSDAHQRSASEYAHRPNLRNVFSESSPNTSPLTSSSTLASPSSRAYADSGAGAGRKTPPPGRLLLNSNSTTAQGGKPPMSAPLYPRAGGIKTGEGGSKGLLARDEAANSSSGPSPTDPRSKRRGSSKPHSSRTISMDRIPPTSPRRFSTDSSFSHSNHSVGYSSSDDTPSPHPATRSTQNLRRTAPGVAASQAARRTSSPDSSIQSLIRLNVSALDDLDAGKGTGEGGIGKGRSLSLSLDTLGPKKKRHASVRSAEIPDSVHRVSSTKSTTLLSDLANIVSTQGFDLIQIYENFNRLPPPPSQGARRPTTAASTSDLNARKNQTNIALTVFRGIMESIRKLMEIANCLVPVGGLRAAAVKLTAKEREAEREIAGAEEGGWKGVRELREAILQTVHEADKVVSSYVEAQGKLIIKTADGFRLEAIGPDNGLRSTTGTIADTTTAEGDPSYGSYKLEYVDEDAGYYRRHFLGNEHRNYIGDMPKLGPVIISLMYKPGSQKADVPYSQSPPAVVGGSMGGGQGGEKDQGAEFWAIMRTKDAQPLRAVIDAARVTASSVLRQNPKHDVKAALQMLHRDIQPGKLRKVAGEGFERRLVALDELLTVTRYKFGVLYCKAGQTTEEEFFGNETGSPAFDRFLTRIGDKIDLSTWTGYSAGLDTKHGQTGKWSLYTKWRHFEVMYHVSTFLPYKKEDRQQIQRKRHIGNDIVAIIFIDGDTPFDPKSIKSQFLHIFIAVQEDRHTRPGKIGYRVVLASNVDVPPYGPPLPTPPVFWDEAEMRDFLLGKMINGENASYKAPKFQKPHHRTRNAMMDEILRDYATASSSSATASKSSKRGTVNANDDRSSAAASPVVHRPSTGLMSEPPTPSGENPAELPGEQPPPRRGSVFTSLGGVLARRASVPDHTTDGAGSTHKRAEADPAETGRGKSGGSNVTPGEEMEKEKEKDAKKKKGKKLGRSKSTRESLDVATRRSTTALNSSAESLADNEGGKKSRTASSSLLAAFSGLKRRATEEKKIKSREDVSKEKGRSREGLGDEAGGAGGRGMSPSKSAVLES